MGAVDIFIELAHRLRLLQSGDNPAEAAALLNWFRAGGFATLKGGLLSFLTPPNQLCGENPELKGQHQIVTNKWTVAEVARKAPPPGWRDTFTTYLPALKSASNKVAASEKACHCEAIPNRADIFRAFNLCPRQYTRVVIIGQDPYYTVTRGQPIADGLAFSVRPGASVPGSLRNIFIELAKEYPRHFKVPNHGNLEKWAEQGILLLNISLSTLPGKPNVHKDYWMDFIKGVFKDLGKANPRCIYLLMGKEAQKITKYLNKGARIITAVHPSPRSAGKGFFGSGVFRQIDAYLISDGTAPIMWQI